MEKLRNPRTLLILVARIRAHKSATGTEYPITPDLVLFRAEEVRTKLYTAMLFSLLKRDFLVSITSKTKVLPKFVESPRKLVPIIITLQATK